jgi:arylsulfatase A-like enzyme
MKNRYIAKTIYLGLAIGFFTGLGKAIYYIAASGYVEQRMFRLILLSLQDNINKWVFFSFFGAILFSVIVIALIRLKLVRWSLVKMFGKFKGGIFEKYIVRAALLFVIPCIAVLNFVIFVDRVFNPPKSPNIIWIVIDALRADHLGSFGYEKDTSPFIDKFAKENVLFENAFSQESYTMASTPSYFTSTYPATHGVLYDSPKMDILDSKFLTIAEILRNANYNTVAFVFNNHLKARFNFGQGFDLYDDDKENPIFDLRSRKVKETAKKIYERTEQYLRKNKIRPLFLYLHYIDVHMPYVPPPPYDKLFPPIGEDRSAFNISQYDGEIKYTDYYIEKTLRMLENYNINPSNSVVIITADHGEEFFDYHPGDGGGEKHGRTLYMEQIHVPLIIALPSGLFKRVKIWSYAGLIDIAPTILDVLNMNGKDYGQFQGKSLIPLIKKENHGPSFIYSGASHGRGVLIEEGYKYYLYDKHSKVDDITFSIRPPNNYDYLFEEEIYNIGLDPKETKNLINEEAMKAVLLKFKDKLRALKERFPLNNADSSVRIDEQTKEALRSLGYLQ